MKNATEVVTDLYRKFPKVEFIDERDLGNDMVGLMFEYRDSEVNEQQLKELLDSYGNWYRVRESSIYYGGKSLLVKAEDDYITVPVEDDLGADWYYKHRDDYDPYGEPKPDYLLGEAVQGERAFMLRKGVLPDGTDSMLFIVTPSNRLCIVNGKEGMNDPTNTEPLYMQGEKATIGGWEEELDKDTIVSLYLYQDGIVIDDADEEIDTEEDPEEGRFKKIASKSVLDSDGFYTDYTWYFDNEDRKHVFVFGDNEIYFPEDEDYDWEVDGDDEQAQAEAQEWFDSYNGFEEDDYSESLKEAIDLEKIVNTSAPRFSWRDKYEKFKRDALQYDYCVVKSSRWYDPEGLDVPSNAEIVFAGTKQECFGKLDQIVSEQCKVGHGQPVVEDRGDDYITIYYPSAVAKATFKVVSSNQINESLKENVSDSESDWAMDNELKKTKLKTIDDDSPVYKSKAGKYFSLGSDDKYSGTFPEYCYDSEDPASCEKQFKSGMWTNKGKFDKASGKYVKEDYCDMFGCESGFFTRDDLNELMYEINDRCPKGMQATAIYMGDDKKTLEVDMEDDEYGSETVYKKIDMRKIRKPSDLLRYANSIIADFQNTVGKWEVGNEE